MITKVTKFISNFLLIFSLTIGGFFAINYFLGARAFSFFIVTSGSMEPSIGTGSVVVVAPRPDYFPGEVLTFRSGPKSVTTHRVLAKSWPKDITNPPTFITKGDANDSTDTNQLALENVTGKVVLTIPYVGLISSVAKTPMGFIFLVVVPGTIIVYEELCSLMSHVRKLPRAAIAIPIVCAFFVGLGLTGAYFSDLEVSSKNNLSISTPTPTPTPPVLPE
ncbi:MAG: signal peptidase I [Patescibacteria group bacterium]